MRNISAAAEPLPLAASAPLGNKREEKQGITGGVGRMSPTRSEAAAPDTEFRTGWPALLACFGTAVFAWGFGFYGQSVYLAELQALRHWPAALIGAATTVFYLAGALLMPFVHRVLGTIGPRFLLAGGLLLMGMGASLFAGARAPWHLFAAGLLMAVGWAGTSGTAIATTLALWFDRRRGLAISLALNGASASGFTIAPLLVQLSHGIGLPRAVPLTAAAALVLVLPIVLFGTATPPAGRPGIRAHGVATDARPGYGSQRAALRDPRVWSVAAPFALAIAAQVGFIVNMVAFLLPLIGPTDTGFAVAAASFAAMGGRLLLGTVIDRLPQRPVSALSFLSQAAGLALLLTRPDSPRALFGGCVLFGLSVGNVITLPALLVQREFAGASFGLVVGLSAAIGQFALALAPGAIGVLHDATGSYDAVLLGCIALQSIAAGLVLWLPRVRPGDRRWA